VFGHAVAEGVAGDFKEPAGFGDVPAGFAEGFFQHLLLHVLKRQTEGEQGRLEFAARLIGSFSGPDGGREVLGFDLICLAGNREPLDHIVKFSDVARPMMTL